MPDLLSAVRLVSDVPRPLESEEQMLIDTALRMLDPLDLQLLALLEMDGRMSHARLARRVGRSRSAIQERIDRLERMGHIAGYTIRRGDSSTAIRAYLLVSGSSASHEQLA